jgi:3-methyladenine DNA glycosylase Mpg
MGRAAALKPSRNKGGHPPLSRAELPVDTVSLARYLIGKILVREMAEGVVSGRIVETEAYVVGDAAGHAYRGMTPRNRSLFLERGHGYIYLVYGSAYMLNVSSEIAGIGAGVLNPGGGGTHEKNRGSTPRTNSVRNSAGEEDRVDPGRLICLGPLNGFVEVGDRQRTGATGDNEVLVLPRRQRGFHLASTLFDRAQAFFIDGHVHGRITSRADLRRKRRGADAAV